MINIYTLTRFAGYTIYERCRNGIGTFLLSWYIHFTRFFYDIIYLYRSCTLIYKKFQREGIYFKILYIFHKPDLDLRGNWPIKYVNWQRACKYVIEINKFAIWWWQMDLIYRSNIYASMSSCYCYLSQPNTYAIKHFQMKIQLFQETNPSWIVLINIYE